MVVLWMLLTTPYMPQILKDMLGSNGICIGTKRNIVSTQPVVVWGRAEKWMERGEDGRDKERGIPETELHKTFSVALLPRITNNPPTYSLIDMPHVQRH